MPLSSERAKIIYNEIIRVRRGGSKLHEYINELSLGDPAAKWIVHAAIEKNPDVFEECGIFKSDVDTALLAVSKKGTLLQYVFGGLYKNKQVVLAALKQSLAAKQYVSRDLQEEIEALQRECKCGVVYALELLMAIDAVNADSSIIARPPNKVFSDRLFILYLVKKNGLILEHCSTDHRRDEEIMLAAVANNGMALRHAILRFKGNKNVVLTAMLQNPDAWQFASEELRQSVENYRAAYGCSIIDALRTDLVVTPQATVSEEAQSAESDESESDESDVFNNQYRFIPTNLVFWSANGRTQRVTDRDLLEWVGQRVINLL